MAFVWSTKRRVKSNGQRTGRSDLETWKGDFKYYHGSRITCVESILQYMMLISDCLVSRRNMHNNLRITRILKSLGELGFERYQAPLVHFFLEETLVKKTLNSVKRSVLDYFLFAVLDKEKRQDLVRFAYLHYEPKDKFVWCPRKIQKQFRKVENKWDASGEEVCSRGKSKDGETAQHKEDGLNKVTKDQRGMEKRASKDTLKLCESPPDPKPEDETVRNGNVESTNETLRNGNNADDVDEMDQSSSPDTVTVTEACADKEPKSNNSPASLQEPDIVQTVGDIDTEKPPKKKREDNVLPSNGSAAKLTSGQMEENSGAAKTDGQTGSSAQTPLKTSKHSPSPCLGREEKIPRTDFNEVSGKREDEVRSQVDVKATNGSVCADEGEQTNGKDSEVVDMESQIPTPDQKVQNS